MDDLDAVLASLEHTDTALRTKPTVDVQIVDAPLTQTMTELDKLLSTKIEAPLTQITTDLDKDFAAELEAISAPPIKKMSLKLDAVHDTFSVQTLDVGFGKKKGKNGKKNTATASTRNNQIDDISEIQEESVEHKDEGLEKLEGSLEYHISTLQYEMLQANTTNDYYSTTKFDSTTKEIDKIEQRVHRNITDLHIHNEGAKFYLLQVHTYLYNLKTTKLFDEEDKSQAWKKYRIYQVLVVELSKTVYRCIVDLEKISKNMLPFISKEYLKEKEKERDMRVNRSMQESTIINGFYDGKHGYFNDEQHLNHPSDTVRKGIATKDSSEITQATEDEGQYDHDATQAMYDNMQLELKALNDKTKRASDLLKTVDNFIQSEKRKGTFQSNEKTEKADKLHGDLMVEFVEMSLQRSQTQKYMRSWREHVKNHVPTDSPDSKLLPTYNSFETNAVDFELELEGAIDERLLELRKICTIEYIKTIPAFEAKHKVSFTKTHAPDPHAPSAFHGLHAPTTFRTELICFAQKLITLVYPSTRVPPWSTSVNDSRTSMPRKHNSDVHNKHLVDLCARVAHITAVADRHPLLAALRFALEITPKSPLLIHALKSTPTVLASRAASEPHTNIVSIRACLAEDKLNRLIRIADADLNRMRIEEQEILNQLRHSKGNKIPQSVHTKKSRITTHKHNHSHADQDHKHQHQNQVHNDDASQSSKKSNKSKPGWGNGWGLFNKADELVHSFTPRASNQQTHKDGDVTGTSV
jgi:hypothetical protein